MSSWLRDLPAIHRLALAALLSAATWAVARYLPLESVLSWQARTGYWILLATFVVWIRSLARVLPSAWRSLDWQPADRWALIVLVACGGILLGHGTRGFQQPDSELELLGSSMAMHWQRAVFLPTQGGEVNGVFELLGGSANTRPLFFPFLVSILHDATGYRPENAFLANGLLTLLLLGLTYVAGRVLAGWKGGLFAVLAWTALPLLGESATGGGADLLNIVMILATALLAGWHGQARDDASLTALVFAGILLAQALFASAILLIGIGAMVLLVAKEPPVRRLPWAVVLSPLLLLPLALQHRVLAALPGALDFSLSHLAANGGRTVGRWLDPGASAPGVILLNALGLVALGLATALLAQRLWQRRELPPAHRAAWIFVGATWLHFGMILGFSWARLDVAAYFRLSLPAHLLFIFGPVLVLAQIPRLRQATTWALALAGLALLSRAWPGDSLAAAPPRPDLATAWRREFIHRQREPDYLVIDHQPLLWLVHRIAAMPVAQARLNPGEIERLLHDRQFPAVYVFQQLVPEPATGTLHVRPGDEFAPARGLETIDERSLRPDVILRVSRVRLANPDAPVNAPAHAATGSPRPKPGDISLETWIKGLP